jgi:hypothetical protein
VAAAEFLLGGSVVIAHNVFRIVPNEVPILTVLFLVSNRRWIGRWRVAGLNRPPSWRWTVGIAIAAAALRLAVGELVIEPLGSRFGPPPAAVCLVVFFLGPVAFLEVGPDLHGPKADADADHGAIARPGKAIQRLEHAVTLRGRVAVHVGNPESREGADDRAADLGLLKGTNRGESCGLSELGEISSTPIPSGLVFSWKRGLNIADLQHEDSEACLRAYHRHAAGTRSGIEPSLILPVFGKSEALPPSDDDPRRIL